jgi:hypothetical protein
VRTGFVALALSVENTPMDVIRLSNDPPRFRVTWFRSDGKRRQRTLSAADGVSSLAEARVALRQLADADEEEIRERRAQEQLEFAAFLSRLEEADLVAVVHAVVSEVEARVTQVGRTDALAAVELTTPFRKILADAARRITQSKRPFVQRAEIQRSIEEFQTCDADDAADAPASTSSAEDDTLLRALREIGM